MKPIQGVLGLLFSLAALTGLSGSSANAMGRGHGSDPDVVQGVDLDRYAGDWQEIAHAPNWFQRKCVQSSAHYEKIDATHVSVFNTCLHSNGAVSTISGRASVLNPDAPSKLLVEFKIFDLFHVKGDYWIVDLGKEYEYAVVSGHEKSGLFILSRQAPLPAETLSAILLSLKERGFDVDSLVFDRY
jgi:apolipoprotein D and lipocalin family protein